MLLNVLRPSGTPAPLPFSRCVGSYESISHLPKKSPFPPFPPRPPIPLLHTCGLLEVR